jgi:hypothetical protein
MHGSAAITGIFAANVSGFSPACSPLPKQHQEVATVFRRLLQKSCVTASTMSQAGQEANSAIKPNL